MQIYPWRRNQLIGNDSLVQFLAPRHVWCGRVTVQSILDRIRGDTECLVMAHPFRERFLNVNEDKGGDAFMRELAQTLGHALPSLRYVFIDHPDNDWRYSTGQNRRSERFGKEAHDFVARIGAGTVDVIACQYGINKPNQPGANFGRAPVNLQLWHPERVVEAWSWFARIGMPPRAMSWHRGIGQWAGRGRMPQVADFMFSLMSAYHMGSEAALVWWDPFEVTTGEESRMAEAIERVREVIAIEAADDDDDTNGTRGSWVDLEVQPEAASDGAA